MYQSVQADSADSAPPHSSNIQKLCPNRAKSTSSDSYAWVLRVIRVINNIWKFLNFFIDNWGFLSSFHFVSHRLYFQRKNIYKKRKNISVQKKLTEL